MKSGWCIAGQHADHPDNPCPARWQRFVHVPARGRKPAGIEMLDEWIECDCSCHGKKQTTKSKRKRK